MYVEDIGFQKEGMNNAEEGMYYGFKAFTFWCEEMLKFDASVLYVIRLDIWFSGKKSDIAAQFNKAWV